MRAFAWVGGLFVGWMVFTWVAATVLAWRRMRDLWPLPDPRGDA